MRSILLIMWTAFQSFILRHNNKNLLKKLLSSKAYHAGAKPPLKGIIRAWQFWLI